MFFRWTCLLFSLVAFVGAVWDDEAFNVDWHIAQLGPIDTVVTHPDNNMAAEHVTVLSKSNILASVALGEVVWRVQLDGHSALVLLDENTVATVTNRKDGTGVVSTWDVRTGFLKAELAVFDKQILDIESSNDCKTLVVALHDGSIVSIDAETSEVSTKGVLPPFDELKINVLENGNIIALFKIRSSNAARYAFYDGSELKIRNLSVTYETVVEFYGAKIIAFANNRFYALTIDKRSGEQSPPVKLITGERDNLLGLHNDGLVAFEEDRNIEVYTVEGTKQFTIPNVYKYNLQFVNGVFILYTEYHANIIDPEDGTEIVSHFLGDDKILFDDVKKITITTNGVDIISSLFEYFDDSYEFRHNTEILWKRNFSVTRAVAHTVIDIEEDTHVEEEIRHEEELEIVEAYLYRLIRHFNDLKDFSHRIIDGLPSLLKGEWPFSTASKDVYFGFVKYLILATRNGQIVALNTLNGQKVWTFDTHQDDIVDLVGIDGKVHVFTASGPRFFIDSKTGTEIDKQLLQPAKKIMVLNKANESFLLETPSGLDLILSKYEYDGYIVKHDEKVIAGFKVKDRKTHETWKFEAGSDEIIVGYASRSEDEKTANVGVVLGDRSVLYKYLYPNVAAVGVLNQRTLTLYINILDTVTGAILYTAYHDAGVHAGSFNVVVGEHWVVYSYYSNLPTADQKIVVVDLFESLTPNVRFTDSETASSFDERQPPAVLSKSFVLPYRIKGLGLTETRFGVTTRTVILALENNQVAYLPKYILNSRRVSGRDLTGDEKAEFMMMPYEPIIRLDDGLVLSHSRDIMGVQTIVSLATNLESTSIVCTYGLDVFCTRVSPSSQFDRLTAGFDKVKMVGSLVVLFVIVLVLKPMKSSKELQRLWVIEPSR